jgi:hypothetical protein
MPQSFLLGMSGWANELSSDALEGSSATAVAVVDAGALSLGFIFNSSDLI